MSEARTGVARAREQVSRRQWLRVAGTSAGTLLLTRMMAGCGSSTGSPPSGRVGGGKVSDLKLDTLQVLGSNVVVGRDSGGIYAMSAICTHQGCILEDTAGTVAAGLYCACHGSSFDGNGEVTHGPARQALPHYQVTIAADGTITVDGSKPVGADVRVPAS